MSMLKPGRPLFLILFILFAGSLQDLSARDTGVSNQARSLMREFFDKNNTPGLVVSVGLGGKIVWSAGFGFADLEQWVPADPTRTRFRIGSVIKSMTAYATAQLVQAGRLDLDMAVQTYLPGYPTKQMPITTRQLLGHLSGTRHYRGEEFFSREYYESVRAGLAIFQDDPLESLPGEAFLYSSYGFNLVSAIIEAVSGQEYLAYMSANVFEPLGMDHTVPDHLGQIIPGRGRYYHEKEGKILNTPEVDNSYKWASGGFIGSSDDLVRFGLGQFNNHSVSDSTRDMFWTVQITNSGEDAAYGLGWRLMIDEDGHKWIGHGGGSVGGTTQFWIRPDTGLVIAMISNLSDFDFGTILISLGKVFVPG